MYDLRREIYMVWKEEDKEKFKDDLLYVETFIQEYNWDRREKKGMGNWKVT